MIKREMYIGDYYSARYDKNDDGFETLVITDIETGREIVLTDYAVDNLREVLNTKE